MQIRTLLLCEVQKMHIRNRQTLLQVICILIFEDTNKLF